MIFPLAAATLTVVLDGTPVRSYNRPYIAGGHVMAPLDPYVTAIARSIEYDGRALIVRLGDLFAQVPMSGAPPPGRYQTTYVELAPIARTLGARVWFDGAAQTLYVQMPRVAFATPTPFNPAVPHPSPTAVFTPTPVQTPRPVVTGTPLPRRTPVPAQWLPSPAPQIRAR
ncbi:MAG TPA: hypothetical protein VFH72_06315 [Candidatus Baltobacteraceae bacterium]|jgi:hypothetical protein|nr:hypothetical protein [Candidatus Baltobacteraceae bacterium]